jgi:hypothetical protein
MRRDLLRPEELTERLLIPGVERLLPALGVRGAQRGIRVRVQAVAQQPDHVRVIAIRPIRQPQPLVAQEHLENVVDRLRLRHRGAQSTRGGCTTANVTRAIGGVRERPYAAVMLRGGDEAFEELAALGDADEVCRRLLASPWGWGRSTRHEEAVELLTGVSATSELPPAFVALMICNCQRWGRVTARLITALEHSELLDAASLDELAEALLSHEHVIAYPPALVSPEWLDVELHDRSGNVRVVDQDTLAQHRTRPEPPLRRWAARRALRANPARLEQLLSDADLFAPRHRDAVIRGLLDAADMLDVTERRRLVDRGLHGGQSSVRLAALDLLCELDGPDEARHRAHVDTNATVRKWQPPIELTQPTLL